MGSNLQNAVRFSEKGPIDKVLSVSSIPIPEVPPSHVLVQIHASAINLSDVGNVEGRFRQTTLPRTPGRDFAGTVVQGPPETIGTKVWGTGGTNSVDRDGSHAEYIVIPSDCVSEIPKNLSFAQAAACGVGYLTAGAMVEQAKLREGDYVLVLGSSGAVGSAATQLIRRLGAIPLETSRKGDGAAININEDLQPQIEAKTKGKGIIAVIDTVGEAALFKNALTVMGDDGRYIFITAGRTPGFQFTFDALEFYRHNKSLLGLNTLKISFKEAVTFLASLKEGFEAGVLTPPALIEESELKDERAVLRAFGKVKAGEKGKQVLVSRKE